MFKCVLVLAASSVLLAVPERDAIPSRILTVEIKPEKPVIGAVQFGTVAFLTDRSLVASLCDLPWCELHTFKIEDGKLQEIAKLPVPDSFSDIFRGPDGSLLLEHLYGKDFEGAVQLDLGLKGIQVLNKVWLNRDCLSATGKTFVNQAVNDHWIAHRTSNPQDTLREGGGRAVSVSDDEVVFEANGTLFVETMDGKRLSSFATGYAHGGMVRGGATLLGNDRILFRNAVRNLRGESLVHFPRRRGFSYRQGMSNDGSIVLFDESSRRLSPMRAFGEAITLAALNAPDNTEIIRVVNANTGKVCFEKERTLDQVQPGYHADLDPTGKTIVILEGSELSIYQLPSSCSVTRH